MSAALGLHRLQQVDRDIDRSRAELDRIQRQLDDDSLLKRILEQHEARGRELDAARRELEAAESAVSAQRSKVGQVEASLYGGKVKNPKELQDLEAETASLRRNLSRLEDLQLERMGGVEAAERAMQEVTAALEQAQASTGQEKQRLGAAREALMEGLDRLTSERRAVITDVAAKLRSEYEALRSAKHGLAVAEVADGACAACGTSLGAALMQAARSAHALSHCPTCGRILYAP